VGEASLAATIERAIEARAGLNVAVEQTGNLVVLSGRVDTAEARQAAEDIAAGLAGGRRVDNGLDVEAVLPVDVGDFNADGPSAGDLPDTMAELAATESEIDPDFTDQPLGTDTLETAGVDALEESDEPYFPPTDPVVTSDAQGNLRVVGGFSATSMDDVTVAPSASDNAPGDEALAEAILRELREDALTTDLQLRVAVREGVAYLRGEVPHLQDAENAEAVAGRVPGLGGVVDELTVTDRQA
jgi:osmotically-inducible protein OsmY